MLDLYIGRIRGLGAPVTPAIDGDIHKAIQSDTLMARFMGPTWGPSGADRTQVGPMSAPWTLLYGYVTRHLPNNAKQYNEKYRMQLLYKWLSNAVNVNCFFPTYLEFPNMTPLSDPLTWHHCLIQKTWYDALSNISLTVSCLKSVSAKNKPT